MTRKAKQAATAETVDQLMRRLDPEKSWEEFADGAGISTQTMRRLRFGKGKRPQRTTLARLAKAAKCTIEEWESAISASRAAADA